MHKVLVFDLDGTLAEPAQRTAEADVQKLIELENNGYTIVLCSGKTSYYLCGFARQLGLKNPILVGENGGTFQFGIDLPPKRYEEYPFKQKAKFQQQRIKMLIDEKFAGKIWYQPNLVGLSPFPADDETFSALQELIDDEQSELDELLIYRHWDCFDLIPKNVNKKNGLLYLVELLGLEKEDVVAIGDGVNDIPMFEFADVAIGVVGKDSPIQPYVDESFASIGQVLDFILEKQL